MAVKTAKKSLISPPKIILLVLKEAKNADRAFFWR
jgi:hypothetical protein